MSSKIKLKATYGGYKEVAQYGTSEDEWANYYKTYGLQNAPSPQYKAPAQPTITPVSQMQVPPSATAPVNQQKTGDYSGSVNTINNVANTAFDVYNGIQQTKGRIANGISNGIAGLAGIASLFTEAQLRRSENEKRIESLQNAPYENSNRGLNNIPIYTKYGGGPGKKSMISESTSVAKKQLKGKPLTNDEILDSENKDFANIYTKDKYPEVNINYHDKNNALIKNSDGSPRAYNKDNEIFINQKFIDDELPAELAHTEQYRKTNNLKKSLRYYKDSYNAGDNYEKTYNIKGSLEYEAHKEIEPHLKKDYKRYVEDLLNLPFSRDEDLKKQLGSIKKQNGGYGTNVEAEAGEVFDNGQEILKIDDDANTHDEGGVNIQAERVLENTSTLRKDPTSEALKLSKDQVELMSGFKPKRAMSHSDAYEFEAKKNSEIQEKFLKAISKVTSAKNPDKYAIESGNLNTKLGLGQLPSENQIFDKYFDNQESVKQDIGFYENEGKAKYGKAEDGYINPYRKGKSKSPTGKDTNFPGTDEDWKGYQTVWEDNLGKKYTNDYGGTYDLQYDAYNWSLENDPQSIRNMWKTYGLNTKAKQNGVKYDVNNLTDEQLKDLRTQYVDGLSGARMLQPSFDNERIGPIDPLKPRQGTVLPSAALPTTDNYSAAALTAPLPPPSNPNVLGQVAKTVADEFKQPLEWYDTIGPSAQILSALRRDPELYNPVNISQARLQQQDVRPALNNSQAEYQAAIQNLGNDSIGAAQKAQIFSNKLRQDNQVIGQYENQNKNIQNQETQYNTQARDRQEAANAQSRESFYSKVLQGRAKQEEQLLTGIDAMAKTFAENRAFNKNANLIMKLAPNFNEKGNYNGVPVKFASNGSKDPGFATTNGKPVVNEKGQYLLRTRTKDGKVTEEYVDKSYYDKMTSTASPTAIQNQLLMDAVKSGRKGK